MNWIYIGKIVNTHGIKGEVRLLSNFSKKALVFKKDFIDAFHSGVARRLPDGI